MNVVILQPSYIPWRGYFHQVAKADLFIFYDDVQYDKHGWRNRNQIKTAQGKHWLTIPVHSAGASHGLSILDVKIDWARPWAANHWKALAFSYAKAPYFHQYASLLEPFYQRHDTLLADFTIDTTIAIARELGISHTRFIRSSEIPGIDGQKTDRLIQILTRVGTTHYISGPSAKGYIEEDKFAQAGITLEYMSYNYREYPQIYPPYDWQVSIVDLLFMTGPGALKFIL
ncbi:MAG: hypothetical protein EHM81_06170 [Chloroflexi bacterium]|nr:MAG: hypothetical protein EHM81_06170 [Chloroflexota bacterium]